MVQFNMTRKLWPTSKNMLYLASSAVLTRLGVAGARVWQSEPSKNHNPDYSEAEKYSALWERFFVEIFGTIGYMVAIHSGMDLFANFTEQKLKIPEFKYGRDKLPGFGDKKTEALFNQINQAIRDVYGESENGVIKRSIFEGASRKKLFGRLKELGIDLENSVIKKQVLNKLDHYIMKVNRHCAYTCGAGILLGALFGGVVIQFANDRIFAPYVVPFINKILGIGDKPRQVLYENNPFVSYNTNPASWQTNLTQRERTYRF